MMQMANAATAQGVEIGKAKLRDFLENSETARQALAMPARDKDSDSISMDSLDGRGKLKRERSVKLEDDDDDNL
jgi:hypothetical protein